MTDRGYNYNLFTEDAKSQQSNVAKSYKYMGTYQDFLAPDILTCLYNSMYLLNMLICLYYINVLNISTLRCQSIIHTEKSICIPLPLNKIIYRYS